MSISLADTYDDEEAKKFEGPVVYSFWSAVKYTFTLSLLLWWLPIFGQMIAGYVGGRRAGVALEGHARRTGPGRFHLHRERAGPARGSSPR